MSNFLSKLFSMFKTTKPEHQTNKKSSNKALFSEASAVVKVDGGWIIASDEKSVGFWFTTSLSDFSKAKKLAWHGLPVMDDVEVMFMRDHTLWVVCSGSTTKSGKDGQERRLLMAVDHPMNESKRKIHVYKYLRETISGATNAGPTSKLIHDSVGKSPEDGGYNIEGGSSSLP